MADLVADILACFSSLADSHAETIGQLARYGAVDEAKTLETARKDLLATITDVRGSYEYLTVDQYAGLAGVSPITVQRWCRNGELQGEQTAKGWRIRRTAVRQKPRA